MRRDLPIIVSFSGIDGAGKSTQIDRLCNFLHNRGVSWRLYSFWDNVVAFSRFRESCSSRLFKGDKGIGSPEKPIERRDKNVRSWPMVVLRLFLYLADAYCLYRLLSRNARDNSEVIIFDRYIYDEWANLPLHHWWIQLYIGLLSRVVRRPDVALVLDADSFSAHYRKPEYPLEFVEQNRQAYLRLAQNIEMAVITAGSIGQTAASVRAEVLRVLQSKRLLAFPSKTPEKSPQPG